MKDDTPLIIRAAAGDLGAWTEVVHRWTNARRHAAALLILDESPAPAAIISTCAVLGYDAPAYLRERAQCVARDLRPSDLPHSRRIPAGIAADLVVAFASALPMDARRTLIASVARSSSAIRYAAKHAWDALDDADRLTLVRAAARHADQDCAVALLARGGAAMIALLNANVCAALIAPVVTDPHAAANAIAGLGAAGLMALDADARTALLAAAARAPAAAANAIAGLGSAGLMALDAGDRTALVASAISDPSAAAAANAIAGLGAAGLMALDADARDAFIRSATANPRNAAIAIGGLGAAGLKALDADARTALLDAAARDPAAATSAIAGLGADGMAALPDEWRTALLAAAARAPAAAARAPAAAADAIAGLGADGMAALPDEWRTALLAAAARAPVEAIAWATFAVGATLTEPERRKLRGALLGPDASGAVAHALAQGAPWRAWMQEFFPDAHAPDDAIAAWRAAADRLPSAAVAALIARAGAARGSLAPLPHRAER